MIVSYIRDHPLLSAFCRGTESTLGGGINPVVHFQKLLVLATVSVHETSLANQHFYSTHLRRKEGVCKKSTLCTLVKMLDGPLAMRDIFRA